MTPEEASRIAEIVGMADGGCSHCASDLARHLTEEWPNYDWETTVMESAEMGSDERPRHHRFEPCPAFAQEAKPVVPEDDPRLGGQP